jgi:hypothetical protein
MSVTDYVDVHGQPFDLELARTKALQEGALRPRRAQAKARSSEAHENFASLGWLVEGFTRSRIDEAKAARLKAIEQHAAALAGGVKWEGKAPRAWDEEQYLHTARPQRVRSRPFEIHGAAQQLAEMATKQGWLAVRVTEIRRERKE